MNMSIAVRRTLLCRALVVSVIDMCREGSTASGPAGGIILDRLTRLAAGILRQLSGGADSLQFDRKSQKAFLSSLEAVKDQILTTLPDGEVDQRAWTAAVLLWVEDHRENIPPFPPERRHTWFKVAENLQALSELMDPAREDAPVELGMGYGEALKQASGVW